MLFPSAACELFFQPKDLSAADDGGGGQDGPGGGDAPGGDSPNGGGTPPSCKDSKSAMKCGPSNDQDCCLSKVVPAARPTPYLRSYDGVLNTDAGNPATVSEVRLDVYEVTVGRFRKFVDAYPASIPKVGSGLSKAGGDPGWKDDQNKMAGDAGILSTNVQSCSASTWTATEGKNETLPMNCVLHVEAYAFCIWDGGRLPTEAEWNLAAAGGTKQRVYPWSDPADSGAISAANAVYAPSALSNVGATSPAGDGLWGHADLAGNLAEWTLDYWNGDTYPNPCDDCAAVQTPSGTRVVRGGAFTSNADGLYTAVRANQDPLHRLNDVGIRCAREP